jgi:hypothetical protein
LPSQHCTGNGSAESGEAPVRLGLTPAGGTFMCLGLSIMWYSNEAFHKLSYETEQVYNFSSVTAALHELTVIFSSFKTTGA